MTKDPRNERSFLTAAVFMLVMRAKSFDEMVNCDSGT